MTDNLVAFSKMERVYVSFMDLIVRSDILSRDCTSDLNQVYMFSLKNQQDIAFKVFDRRKPLENLKGHLLVKDFLARNLDIFCESRVRFKINSRS